ncbi:hypothetical protein D6850_18875 [Roseovarius spongiae]|uniref:SHOCT domain-containing protein n=1 Tax=Roseovarius spongiae TaxID=2320272 RepID=A0A3A8B1F0_9RHOB|nr:SHOCT domain-containing protein [Roseovarius spongiae]RKF12290.1 hypothetical protein D6850_18875 [Roseovarius spongiae]
MKHLALPVISVCAMASAGPASAAPNGDWRAGYGHMMWNGGHGIFGGLMMVIFWAFIIGLIFLAVRGFSTRSDTGNGQTAMDVLRERYARGEIDEDEFERRLAKLESPKR